MSTGHGEQLPPARHTLEIVRAAVDECEPEPATCSGYRGAEGVCLPERLLPVPVEKGVPGPRYA